MATAVTTTDFSKAPSNAKLSTEQKVKMLTDMVRIRCFEMESKRQYEAKGKIGGFLHLYNGQESVAVGCVSLMGDDDQIGRAHV